MPCSPNHQLTEFVNEARARTSYSPHTKRGGWPVRSSRGGRRFPAPRAQAVSRNSVPGSSPGLAWRESVERPEHELVARDGVPVEFVEVDALDQRHHDLRGFFCVLCVEPGVLEQTPQ